MTSNVLLTIHNVSVMEKLMTKIREAKEGDFFLRFASRVIKENFIKKAMKDN